MFFLIAIVITGNIKATWKQQFTTWQAFSSFICSYVHWCISPSDSFLVFVTRSKSFQVMLVHYTRSKQSIFSTVNKPTFLNLSKVIQACVLSLKFGLQQDAQQTQMCHCTYFRSLLGDHYAAFFVQINRKILFTKC